MKKLTIATLAILVSSCATNRLHFEAYTDAATLDRIRSAAVPVSLQAVTPPEPCSPCSESSSAVWHAANLDGKFYEGFFRIPIADWNGLIASSLDSVPGGLNSSGVSVEVKRVFLKTWQQPKYAACLVELVVTDRFGSRRGAASIKLPNVGQALLARDRVQLGAEVETLIRLSIRAAYIDANSRK
jgi:hypothetical protein